MARDSDPGWAGLSVPGEHLASEEDYEHGYKREVRQDLEQYVTFTVQGERHALAIERIAEISKLLPVTPVPRTADFVLGIGNVRGSVIPIIDLAVRLRLRTVSKFTRSARTLIVREHDELHGLVVDAVHDVVTLAPEELEEAPGAIAGPRGDYIQSLARWGNALLIVLEPATVLRAEDFVAPGIRPARRSA
jgi:purine-binding chemotaxis protein CheW